MEGKRPQNRWAEHCSASHVILLPRDESIFSAVFDKAEPMLHARWIPLKNQLGFAYRVDVSAIETVAAFADAELGALILQGNSQLNPGLPSIDRKSEE